VAKPIAKPATAPRLQARFAPLHHFLVNKWFFDELIDFIVVRPAQWFGRFAESVLERVVIGDGVRPSNTGRGYVLRRLIRRALTTLWRDDSSRTLGDLPGPLIEQTLEHFRQEGDVGQVSGVLRDEQRRFGELLVRGRTVLSRRTATGLPTEQELRYLHETHGLPRELVVGLLSERA